jgi:hypothetical protein
MLYLEWNPDFLLLGLVPLCNVQYLWCPPFVVFRSAVITWNLKQGTSLADVIMLT